MVQPNSTLRHAAASVHSFIRFVLDMCLPQGSGMYSPDEVRGDDSQTLWVFLCLLMLPVTSVVALCYFSSCAL